MGMQKKGMTPEQLAECIAHRAEYNRLYKTTGFIAVSTEGVHLDYDAFVRTFKAYTATPFDAECSYLETLYEGVRIYCLSPRVKDEA